MAHLFHDLRYALRMLLRTKAFSAIGILTLGTGIALITAVFSLTSAFFLRPLAFEQPQQLVHVWQTDGKIDLDTARMSVPNYQDLRARSRDFEDLGGYYYSTYVLSADDTTSTINATELTPNLIPLLGVEPALGRSFTDQDLLDGDGQIALLSHSFWLRAFGGRSDVLGETLILDNLPHTVVGVMPESFVFPFNKMDLYLPLSLLPYQEQRASNGPLLVVGRLAQGATPETGQAELTSLMTSLEAEHPVANERVGANVVDLRSQLLFTYDIFAVVFPVLLVAIAFVILIVCSNLGNLILARAQDRSQEMAFRLALGADRKRLVRQLLTENLLLAFLGGALGVTFATFLCRGLEQALPGELYRVGKISVDTRALAFAFTVAAGSALVFGLAPALQSTAVNLSEAMKQGGRGLSSTLKRRRLRSLFVVVQISLAVLLVTGTGLMIKTFTTLQEVDLGFESDNLLTMEITLPDTLYPGDTEENAYFDEVLERTRAVPGVESAATIYPLPLNHESLGGQFEVSGRDNEEDLFASTVWTTPEWFETAGIALQSGRGFDRRDSAEAAPVVMVNRAMAEKIWPGETAIGQRITIRELEREVIGVVENSVYIDLDEETPLIVYYPQQQVSTRRRFVMVRTQSEPMSVWPSVQAAITPIDPAQPIENVREMDEVITAWLGPWMMGIGGISLLGFGALFLAAMGLYGVIRYSVSQRRHEFGVRNALGAGASDILYLVLKEGLSLLGVGLVIGGALAVLMTRFLQSLLFGVGALDPLTFITTLAVLVAVALAACLGPGLRASRSDPLEALRAD